MPRQALSVEQEETVVMLAEMARTRMIIDTEEAIRLAVKLAATKRGISVSELINELLKTALAAEIRDARRYVPKDDEKK